MSVFAKKLCKDNWLKIDLQQAIEQDQIEVFLQPQIRISDFSINSFEALMRWRHPLWGILCPQEFFFEANNLNIMEELDFFVFCKVCEFQYRRMSKGKLLFCIACNFSRKIFAEADFVEVLEQLRNRYKIPAQFLAIEILEGDAFAKEYCMEKNITKLRKLGYAVCLDDCGADNATMSDLLIQNLAQIKLDKKLVDRIERKNVQILLEGICGIAHKMSYEVVCEGVETYKQLELAYKCNVDIVQGYYFYRPMKMADAERVYEEWINGNSLKNITIYSEET